MEKESGIFNYEFRMIPLEDIYPPAIEVRELWNEEELLDLLEDIRRRGLINPITVKVRKEGGYEVVAGHRRFECVRRLGMVFVPCMIRYESDRDAEFIKLAENFKRADVNPVDEGLYYQKLITTYGLSTSEIADAINRSREYVKSRLDIVQGDPLIMEAVRDGQISLGVGLELNKFSSPQRREYFLHWAIQSGATIRLVQQWLKDEEMVYPQEIQQTVTPIDPRAEFQPAKLVFICEISRCEVLPEDVQIIRCCKKCRDWLYKALKALEDIEARE
jgi:ParB family chromosome partitioning protein